ncbi:type IV toxin-antitoxin system AbiEi family antitoxin domain-containing protein [Yinghuangia sp. YIM S09857]|uniref:type IV toxin-antitoxin system AbiEi family antitoxin domain-containing protein n=1 Tax=Yinghuangia sp. YIM S09857 TaxID=3436929 RepID=UPI003F530DE9
MPGDIDLTDLFSKPFTAAQAADRGFSLAVLRRWLRNGDVRRVVQGVYVGSHMPDTPTLRAKAVAAFLPGAVICGRTAAWIWGIGAAGTHDENGRPHPAEFAVPSGATLPRRGGCLGRIRNFEKGEVTTIAGVQVTTPLRTAADIARTEPLPEAVAILDAFLHQRQVTKRQLESMAGRFAGFAGVRRLIEAVRLADAGSTGPEETRLRLSLVAAGVPPAEPGWRVMSAFGRVLHRFTLAWPDLHLAADVEPPRKHPAPDGTSELPTPPVAPTKVPTKTSIETSTEAPPAHRPRAAPSRHESIPDIRVRSRSIGGATWRVVECGPGEATAHPDTVVAHVRHELMTRSSAGPEPARQAA